MNYKELLTILLETDLGDVTLKSFDYRRNKKGEFHTKTGHPIKPGYYGPKRGTGAPILLQFGVWDRSNRTKYDTNEPLLVGLDLRELNVDEIKLIAGPYKDGRPTGGYLKEIMSHKNAKARYKAFIDVIDRVGGPGTAEKILHKGGPVSKTSSGKYIQHGAWRTYISRLAKEKNVRTVSPEQFLALAAKLKAAGLGAKNVYRKLLADLEDSNVNIDVQGKPIDQFDKEEDAAARKSVEPDIKIKSKPKWGVEEPPKPTEEPREREEPEEELEDIIDLDFGEPEKPPINIRYKGRPAKQIEKQVKQPEETEETEEEFKLNPEQEKFADIFSQRLEQRLEAEQGAEELVREPETETTEGEEATEE